MKKLFLAVVDSYLSGEQSHYWGTRGFRSGSADTPAHQHFAGRIKKPAAMRRDLFDFLTTRGRSRAGFGALELVNNAPEREQAGALDDLLDYSFAGWDFRQYFVEEPDGKAFPADFTEVIRAKTSHLELTRTRAKLHLRDAQVEMEQPIQATKYAGTNDPPDGLEGGAELAGKPKPLAFGDVFNVPAVLVNASKLIYQVHDGAVASIPDVRDRGVSLKTTVHEWAAASLPTSETLRDVAWGNGFWVAVGENGTLIYTEDETGETGWTDNSNPGSLVGDLVSVTYSEALGMWLVGSANDGGELKTYAYVVGDPDGAWTASTVSPMTGASYIARILAGPNEILATNSVGDIARSTNGTSWTLVTSGGGTAAAAIAYGQGRWLMVRANGTALYSVDGGLNWLTAPTGPASSPHLTFGQGKFVLAGAGKVAEIPAATLAGWTVRFVDGSPTFTCMGFGGPNGSFLAGAGTSEGSVYFARVPSLWSVADSETLSTNLPKAVAGNSATWVVVGENGTLLTGTTAGSYASEADLLDDELQPAPGTFKVYAAGGYFRLGSPPDGQITADVLQGSTTADRTAGQLFVGVMDKMGVSNYESDDVDALDSFNDGVCGIWVGPEERSAAAVLDEIATTVGAWWGVDRLGTFRIKVVPTPENETAAFTLRARDMLVPLDIREANDPEQGIPFWRTVIRYRRNYAVQTDIAGSVMPESRLLYSQEWQEAPYEDDSVKVPYPDARQLVQGSAFRNQADALAEAVRRQELRGVKRRVYLTAIEADATNLTRDLGDVAELIHPRFQLSAGKNAVVLSVEPDFEKKRINLALWG